VVVAPHGRANQSGVLSVARYLGVRTVAADVGGLSELASNTFVPGDVDGLTRVLDTELAKRAHPPVVRFDEAGAVEAHLRAYGLVAQ
jgi:hypothetical protein